MSASLIRAARARSAADAFRKPDQSAIEVVVVEVVLIGGEQGRVSLAERAVEPVYILAHGFVSAAMRWWAATATNAA